MQSGLKTTSFNKQTKATAPKLGDALIAADIITEFELSNAVQVASQTSQPLGRVLVDLKYVTQKSLDDAATIQVMVLDGMLNGATAIKALGRAHRNNVSVEDALRELGWTPPVPRVDSELGMILVHSGLITKAIYEDAIKTAAEQGTTIGEYLVLRSVLSHTVINAALQTIVLISQEKLNAKDGALLLKDFCTKGGSYWDALSAVGFDSRALKSGRLSLGEVLTQGGFISEAERIASVEKALAEKVMLGELLVQSGLISSRVLESALQVQEIARTGAVTESEAVEVLKSTEKSSSSIKDVLQSRTSDKDKEDADQALELLIAAGVLRQTDVAVAVQTGQRFGVDPLRGLVVAAVIDRTVFEASRELVPQVKSGQRTRNEAIMLLSYVERGRCSLAEAVESINTPRPVHTSEPITLPLPAVSQTTSGKFEAQKKSKTKEEAQRDFASLDQALRKKLAPIFISRFVRSVAILTVLFSFLVLFGTQIKPVDLAMIFTLLVIFETIRLILDLNNKRQEIYELRTLDIEGVQQHTGAPRKRKEDE